MADIDTLSMADQATLREALSIATELYNNALDTEEAEEKMWASDVSEAAAAITTLLEQFSHLAKPC